MKRSAAAAVLLISAAACGSASANPDGPHTVVKVYVASGNPTKLLEHGLTPLHVSKVLCPRNAASCTLVLNAMDQVCNADGAAGNFRAVVKVDGTSVDEGAEGSTMWDCLATSWSGNVIVTSGSHKVELDTETDVNDMYQHNWSVNLTVTTP